MQHEDKKIVKNSRKYENVAEIIDIRRDYRLKMIDFITNILRFFMLAHALKFPWFKHFSHIYISICGIVSTSLSIFNGLIGEQIIRITENKPKLLKSNLTGIEKFNSHKTSKLTNY